MSPAPVASAALDMPCHTGIDSRVRVFRVAGDPRSDDGRAVLPEIVDKRRPTTWRIVWDPVTPAVRGQFLRIRAQCRGVGLVEWQSPEDGAPALYRPRFGRASSRSYGATRLTLELTERI